MTTHKGNFTVYRSSAGSGKTFTLVSEYLVIALSDPRRFRNILAITFTNKAAAEMKNRVLRYLTDLSVAPEAFNRNTREVLLPKLMTATGLSETEISRRAGEILSLILHNYSDFAITTIDSLMHKVVRTFTFDLRLSASFEVDLNRDKMLKDAVGILISQAGTDEKLTQVLLNFVREKASDDKSFNIENDILQLAKTSWELDGTEHHLEKLATLEIEDLQQLHKKITDWNIDFLKRLHKLASEAMQLMKREGINPADFFYGKNGIGGWFQKIASGKANDIRPGLSVLKTIDEDKWITSKCDPDVRARIEPHLGTLRDIALAMRKQIDEGHPRYTLFHLFSRTFYPMILLNEVRKIMTEIKKQENVILISDFNRLISRVVESESVPFIYERLGVRFRNFMIDEFQDTSVLQWHNLIPLLENMLADGNYCMLVGDGKQAIYRWRNGEVAQFVALPEIYNKPNTLDYRIREEALVRNYKEEKLDTNYRSSEVVVNFNNSLYALLAEQLDESNRKIYEGHWQNHHPSKQGGYVQIGFFEDNADDSATGDRISEFIGNLRTDGYRLKDIGLLCRSNRLATALAAHLLNLGIPVVSAESLLLDKNPVVEFLLATHRFLQNPGDHLSRAGIVRYLHLKGMLGKMNLHEALSFTTASAAGFREMLTKHALNLSAAPLLKMAIYDRFEEIVRRMHLNDQADPYLVFFLDCVREYSQGSGRQEDDFEQWWEEKKTSATISIPEGIDAINVMTIHKSKGLEFPVVILPGDINLRSNTMGMTWTEFDDPELPGLPSMLLPNTKDLQSTAFGDLYDIERNKSILDFVNLMYVATTRAAERLYLLLQPPPAKTEAIRTIESAVAALLEKEGTYRSEQNFYTYGHRSTQQPAGPEGLPVKPAAALVSASWQDRAVLSLEYPRSLIAAETQEKIAWGNLLHTAMSRIRTSKDAGSLVDQLAREGLVRGEIEEKLRRQLNAILQHSELAALLDKPGEVRTEASLLDAQGRSYRPDRVTIRQNAFTLLDYKTGHPQEEHKHQLLHYAALLTEMGYTLEQSALVYLDDTNVNIINC